MELRAASGRVLQKFVSIVLVAAAALISACSDSSSGGGAAPGGGGGGGGITPIAMSGAGVDGPLANAIVTLYAIDTGAADFKGEVLGTGTTDEQAQINDIEKPAVADAPYLLEFTADADTRDLTACEDGDSSGTINVATECLAPVVGTLRTIVTAEMLDADRPVYGTLLTTMATDLAIRNADLDGDGNDDGDLADAEDQKAWGDRDGDDAIDAGLGDGTATIAELLSALPVAAGQVKSTVGFGLGSSTDIFTTAPILDEDADTEAEQEEVAAYRAAVQALASVVYQITQSLDGAATTDVLTALTTDLADGAIDGNEGDTAQSLYDSSDTVATATLQLLQQDPATLPVPNDPEGRTVGDMAAILIAEIETTGSDVTEEIDNNFAPEMKPAETDPDLDDDGTPNESDAFPQDDSETTDSDVDGIGNNADTDDDNDGVADANDDFPLNAAESVDTDGDGTGNNADTDDDGDDVADASDDFPLDDSKSDATDVDGDGWPTDQDGNDNDDSVPGTVFVDSDSDGVGNTTDDDDDNDGVADGSDAFPLNATEQSDLDEDGTGDNTDTDIDGDGVANANDKFPRNSSEWTDTDKDGIGNNTDSDDDNDGSSDAAESAAGSNPLDLDSDDDGALDGVDAFPTNNLASFDADADGIPALPANIAPGTDLTGLTFDNCPAVTNPSQLDSDGDNFGDACDKDDDGDEVLDGDDAFPLNNDESADADGDGTGNNSDADDDNDGVDDAFDDFDTNANESVDTDGDGTGNNADTDDDGDGVADVDDDFPLDDSKSNKTDADNDGWPVEQDANDNDDSVPGTTFVDSDGDGEGNTTDTDDDNDGVPDASDDLPLDATDSVDTDNDGTGNKADSDDDNDNVADIDDRFPLDEGESIDTDNDGTGDGTDTDDDNDGVADANDSAPTNPDADDDSVFDGIDNCPAVANADQKNSDLDASGGDACDVNDDGDTRNDVNDNCPLITNEDQLDTDNDSFGNACDGDDDGDGVNDANDAFPLDSEESADGDNDGTGNNGDNCPAIANADQLNSDDDNIGNACDSDDDNDNVSDANEATNGTNPLVADTDGDTVNDGTDNCGLISNIDQLNSDNDATGNVCDADDDNDTVADANDNCPLITNTNQADGNDNGVGDACEAAPAQVAGFWLAAITAATESETGTVPGGGTLADICHTNVGTKKAGVAFVKQNASELHFVFGDDEGDNGDNGTLDGLGNVQFGNTDDGWNQYGTSGFQFSVRESFSFTGTLDDLEAPAAMNGVTITETVTVYTGENQTGSVAATCSYTYTGGLTRMPQVAASALLDSAGTDQGLGFTDSWRNYFEETGVDIFEFGYTTITTDGSADYYWTGSDWQLGDRTSWMLSATGWNEYADAPVLDGTPAQTAIMARGTAGNFGSRWEMSAYAGAITGLPMRELAGEEWEEGLADPAANFAGANARGVGVSVTALMDEYEILCDLNMPKYGLLQCQNWILKSFPATGNDQDLTTDNLANALTDVLHANASVPTTPLGGIPVGRVYNASGETHIFAWLTGSNVSGSVGTGGIVEFYTHTAPSMTSQKIANVAADWNITDPTGTGALVLRFTIPDAIQADEFFGDFEMNRNVVVAAVALSDANPYLRAGHFSPSGTVRQHSGVNGVALGELITGFNYEKPDTDGDGFSDDMDNCPAVANADQVDANGNGRGDVCEGSTDGDGDGVSDANDNCPMMSNANQSNMDGDTLGDVCDNDLDGDGLDNGSDPCPADSTNTCGSTDTDGDGVMDANDNCPTVPNADQADTDVDGIGDACEGGVGLDSDSDGVPDQEDAFDNDANEQRDTDGDGEGDNGDVCPYIADVTDCATSSVSMEGVYVASWTATGQDYDEATQTCVTLTEPSGADLMRIKQIGTQILMQGKSSESKAQDFGSVANNGAFTLGSTGPDHSFALSGTFTEGSTFSATFSETDRGCVQNGTATFTPGAAVAESSIGSSGVVWFEADSERNDFTESEGVFFEYGVLTDSTAETVRSYNPGTRVWDDASANPEPLFVITTAGAVVELHDRFTIDGYVGAGQTAILRPYETDGSTVSTGLVESWVDMEEFNVESLPMRAFMPFEYRQGITPDDTFSAGARAYAVTLTEKITHYEFGCNDDWNAYVAATYQCANIVARSYADLDGDGNTNDPVAATSLDEVVYTPAEFDSGAAIGGALWSGEGMDSGGEFSLSTYLVSDNGNASGSNKTARIVKHYRQVQGNYWDSKIQIAQVAFQSTTAGSIPIIQWDLPAVAVQITEEDDYTSRSFIFVESALDSQPLVRRGVRVTADVTREQDVVFNTVARDQIVAAFNHMAGAYISADGVSIFAFLPNGAYLGVQTQESNGFVGFERGAYWPDGNELYLDVGQNDDGEALLCNLADTESCYGNSMNVEVGNTTLTLQAGTVDEFTVNRQTFSGTGVTGAWIMPGEPVTLMFLPGGVYVAVQWEETNNFTGFEYGTWTLNGSQLEVTVSQNNDGEALLCNEAGATCSMVSYPVMVGSQNLTLTVGSDNFSFERQL